MNKILLLLGGLWLFHSPLHAMDDESHGDGKPVYDISLEKLDIKESESEKNDTTPGENENLQDPYDYLKDPLWKELAPNIIDVKINEFIQKATEQKEEYFESFEREEEKLIDFFNKTQKEPMGKVQKVGIQYYFSKPSKETELINIYSSTRKDLRAAKLVLNLKEAPYIKAHLDNEVNFSEEDFEVSPDGKYLVYKATYFGMDFQILGVYDLKGKKHLPPVKLLTDGQIAWRQDSPDGFYYGGINEFGRPNLIFWHSCEQRSLEEEDLLVFHDTTSSKFISLMNSCDHKYVFLGLAPHDIADELYLLTKGHQLTQIVSKEEKVKCADIDVAGDILYIATNDTENQGAIKKVDLQGDFSQKGVLAPTPSLNFKSLNIFNNQIVVITNDKKGNKLSIYNNEKQELEEIFFPISYASIEFDEDEKSLTNNIVFYYSSMIHPKTKGTLSLKNKKVTLSATSETLKNYRVNDYAITRLEAISHDETQVPITLAYKKDKLRKDGENVLILSAYGAYGEISEQELSAYGLALMNAGIIIAHAHVRGDGDFGPLWYTAGKGLNKENTFKDYIACANHLIGEKWVKPGNLVAQGGSAGGLIMGYIANNTPDLFAAIIASVPFLHLYQDCLNSNLCLNSYESGEWGAVAESKYESYIKSYCPYEGIQKQSYPAMLISYGRFDVNVPYWNAVKYYAKLKDFNTGKAPILLSEFSSGHEVDDEADIEQILFLKSIFKDKIKI